MKVLRIERKQNVETVSSLYKSLKEHGPRCAIQVPTDLDDYRLCGKGDFLQFLLTWSEHCPNAPVVTHIPSSTSQSTTITQLRKLFSQEHGFLLGLITRKFGLHPQRAFLNTAYKEIPADLVETAFTTSRIFETGEPLVKRTRAFVAIDDLIDQSEQILNPYTNVYRRRNPNFSTLKYAFNKLLSELFTRTPGILHQMGASGIDKISPFLLNVTQFTYELFENADRWGARPYDKNVRGILLHIHFKESTNQKPLNQQVGSNNPLSIYLKQFTDSTLHERTPFLELTVFDNGPTLSTHLLGRKARSLPEEGKTTMDCLSLACGRSDKSTEGKGLYETMKLLNACHGFLRYRAKRLSLYRDFLASPLDTGQLKDLEFKPREARNLEMRKVLSLQDWASRTSKLTAHSEAIGAFFTIIVPIEQVIS